MEAYVNSFCVKGAHIPLEKEQEFQERLVALFRAGGMMKASYIDMFGIKVITLQKAHMDDRGINCNYNYFEDNFWENAGYSLEEKRVWSDRTGLLEYRKAVIAAYVLENLYREGTGAVFVDGKLVNEEEYTGWINYLFQEEFCAKNRNPWKLFEAISTMPVQDYFICDIDWSRFSVSSEGMLGYTEIYSVQYGIDAMLQWHVELLAEVGISLKDGEGSLNFYNIVSLIVRAVRSYRADSDLPEDEQFRAICSHMEFFYQNSEMKFSEFRANNELHQSEESLFLGLCLMDLAVIAVKAISETYEKDFWQLWGNFRDMVYKAHRNPLMNLMHMEDPPDKPVSTASFFSRCTDDMLYFWKKDGNMRFSYEMKEWCRTLKKRFDEIMKESFSIAHPVKWILKILSYADEEYYQIYAFSEFFEESIEHLSDRKYIALWKLYEEMLHDPEMESAGSVIFVPKGSEVHSRFDDRSRQLLGSWWIMDRKKRENIARVTFRRYMALVANVDLRKRVFGF